MPTYNSGVGHHQVLMATEIARAEGDVIEDTSGRRYLDLYTNESLPFGHDTSILREVFRAPLPVNVGLYPNVERRALVDKLGTLFPGYTNFQFNTSGTLANEGAMRYAMAITGRSLFAGFAGSFHGRSKALASVSDMDSFNGERITGYLRMPYPGYDPDTLGSTAACAAGRVADPAVADQNLEEIAHILDQAGSEKFAGVLVEPILSKSVIMPPPGWLGRLKRDVLAPRGILLLADENFTAGRVGAWSSAVEQGAAPDLITFSKSFSSGYPFAALACLAEHAEATQRVKGGDAGSAQAPQCRIARLTLERLVDADILGHEGRIEKLFLDLATGLRECGIVTRVAAHGALFGIEMATKEQAVAVGQGCLRRGFLVAVINRGLRLTPALSLPSATLTEGMRGIRAAIDEVAGRLVAR